MSEAILPEQPALDTFGAPKRDMGIVVDPALVITARDWNNVAAMLTALGFVAPRAWASVSSAGALLTWGGVWGNTASPPTAVRNSTGNYSVTAPSSVPDTLDGSAHALAIKTTTAGANTSGRGANSRHTGNVITVETYAFATGLAGDSAFTVLVF